MSVDQRFDAAATSIRNWSKRPSDEKLLEIYALYKQATVGDVNIEKPGLLDLKAKGKWEAWNGKKGISKDAAKEAYIALCDNLKAEYQ